VDVLFPTDGRHTVVHAPAGRRTLRLGGYVLVILEAPAGAALHLLATTAQASAPDPGPTLAVRLVAGRPFRRARLAVRLAPRAPGADPGILAARLHAA
jgi:hypothetical protein